MIRKIKKFLKQPSTRFYCAEQLGLFNHMSDEKYLKKKWKSIFGYDLNLENPKTFNEKLQWIKLHDRKPEYTMMVDKYKVREYIADKIGEEYLIPLIGVWDDPDEIDFDALPNQFVLKCNHNSGTGMCICKDKSKLDIKKVKKELRKGLKENYYLHGREWPYKNVPRKIICEKYMVDHGSDHKDLTDYKMMTFNGKVKATYTCTNRFTKEGVNITFFDTDWKRLPFSRCYCDSDKKDIHKPASYEKMVKYAEILGRNIPFSRIDFYEIDGKPYFGEVTFFPASGFEGFNPSKWDRRLGKLIKVEGGYLVENKQLLLHIPIKENSSDLTDYKFMCFDGKVKCSFTCTERFTRDGLKVTFFDKNWKRMPFERCYPSSKEHIEKPKSYDNMVKMAERLSENIPFSRIDFYEIDGKPYFGEVTFFPGSGFEGFNPSKWDRRLGKLIKVEGGVSGIE